MDRDSAFLPDPSSRQMISKGDVKPEIHFIGQIVGGKEFNTPDGLFCEMLLDVSPNWEMISPPRVFQTQTSYTEPGQIFVWNHPLDFHFAVNDLNGWYNEIQFPPTEFKAFFFARPKAIVRIWRLDISNKIDIISYGVLHFPKTTGYSKLEVNTWTPTGWTMGSYNFQSTAFFLGNYPKLQQMDLVSRTMDKRELINSMSSGKVIFEFEVIMKNFDMLDVTGQV